MTKINQKNEPPKNQLNHVTVACDDVCTRGERARPWLWPEQCEYRRAGDL